MDRRIKALIGAHAVAFVVAAVAAFGHDGPALATMLFLALVFADAGLLGLWAALGNAPRQTRLSATPAALLFFWAAFVFVQEHVTAYDIVGFAFLISLPCLIIFLVLSVFRRGSRQLALRLASDVTAGEGFQFSLSGLLAATALVAIALSVGRVTRVMGDGGTWLRVWAVLVIAAPSFVIVELATFWATLGLARPSLRLLVVIPLGFIVGFASAFGFAPHVDWQSSLLWSGLTGMTAVVIAVSLLIVRSAGWRLCSAANHHHEPTTSVQHCN